MNQPRRIAPVPPRLLIRVFQEAGFQIMRYRGDHLIMTKPGVRRPVVIRTASSVVPITHIMSNLRTAGMSREEYFQLLDRAG